MHTRKGIGGSNPSLSAIPAFAGVIQWQNRSFPSFLRGFDSHRPLHFLIRLFILICGTVVLNTRQVEISIRPS